MNKKVFAFDIDGTVISDTGVVHKNNIEAFKEAKAKGHILALCSGRPTFDMKPVLDQMPEGLFEYEICNNGSYIVDLKSNEVTFCGKLEYRQAEELLAIGKKLGLFMAVHTDKCAKRTFVGDKESELYKKVVSAEWHKFTLVSLEETMQAAKENHITQLSLRGNRKLIAQALEMAKQDDPNGDYHIAGEVYLDLNPTGISKQTGVNKLAEMINIPAEDFVVFGDSGNDLQMLAGPGYSVAMGNATKEAKEAADIVIGDNNSDAISHLVRDVIGGK